MNKCRLGEISKVEWGNTSLTKKSFVDEGEFLAVSAAGADGRIGHAEHESHIPVISAIGANCGRMFFPTEPFTAIKNTMTVTPNYGNDSKFLYYFLSSIKMPKRGAAQPFLALKDIRNIQVPKCEVDKQIKIVSKLDQAFEAIDQAIENIEKNIENVEEMYTNILHNTFESIDSQVFKLEDISNKIGDGLHGTPQYSQEGEYYFINGNNLENGTIVFKSKTKKVDYKEYLKHKKELTLNTILVSINGTLGKVAFYEGEPIILGKSACYINLMDNVDKRFIKYLIQSPVFFKNMNKMSTGATIKNFSLKSMRNYPIPLPSLAEQKGIIERLDDISELSENLKTQNEEKLKNLNELKMSILERAFKGELV